MYIPAVFRFINKSLDQYVIRDVAARFQPPPVADCRIAQAGEYLRQEDYFCNFVQAAADLTFHDKHAFTFRSPMTTPAEANNTVFGRLYRAGRKWQKRPSVILLHGWNGERAYDWQFPWLAWRLNMSGINAAMIELPYHGRRKPQEKGAIRNFISSDLFHMVQAARQAMADGRALLGWLAAQGSPQMGVLGFSMGGWLAGLMACHDARLDFCVLLSPLVNLDSAIKGLSFCEPVRQGLGGRNLQLNPLNLASCKPLTALDKTLLVECRDDQFIPVEDMEAVWRAWDKPVIWRVPHGHISVLMSWPVLERTMRWIARIV